MALAVVASVNFSFNEDQKEEMQKGFFWHAGDKIISTVYSGLSLVSSFSFNNSGEKEKEIINNKNVIVDIWSEFMEKISNISFVGFIDNFKNDKLNLEINENVGEGFKNIFVNEDEDIDIDIDQEIHNKSENLEGLNLEVSS